MTLLTKEDIPDKTLANTLAVPAIWAMVSGIAS